MFWVKLDMKTRLVAKSGLLVSPQGCPFPDLSRNLSARPLPEPAGGRPQLYLTHSDQSQQGDPPGHPLGRWALTLTTSVEGSSRLGPGAFLQVCDVPTGTGQ